MASCKEKAKAESMTEPNWLELPIDLTKNILQRLDTVDIMTSARNVCPLWWNICKDPLMWRTIHTTNNISRLPCLVSLEKKLRCRASGAILIRIIRPSDFRHFESLEKICRRAIDLSCGLVEDIAIDSFVNNELLKYIAHRAGHIRRLQISNASQFLVKGIREFLKDLPLLEELTIEFEMRSTDSAVWCEDDEFPIAKTMPRLRRLKLYGIFLTDVEVQAILDCCPLLESLDLYMCIYHYLSPNVTKRCHEIKYFGPPFYTNDDE